MTKQKKEQALSVKRDYKSSLFTMIYSDKNELLKLYNAVAGTNYEDPELLTITTLDNAIYMAMKNDVSFIIDCRLSLYEHQSTYNPNMPLRFLLYLADMYSSLTSGKNLYGTKKVLIPPPNFIVFYNGVDEEPDYQILKLSDLYEIKSDRISLELLVDMLNINHGHNKELLDACKSLKDYAEYIHRIRKYVNEMSIEEAVERAITECISEDILREFLVKNRRESMKYSIYEYNEAEHIRMEREESFADGFEAGRTEMICLVLKMVEDGMADHVKRLAFEPDFLNEMLKKYSL